MTDQEPEVSEEGSQEWKGRTDYAAVAEVRGDTVLLYETSGDYQGDWDMLSYREGNYYLWSGSYGSCSGCDSLQAEDPHTLDAWKKFAEGYSPFAEVPAGTMRNLAAVGAVGKLFENGRDTWQESVDPGLIAEVTEIVIIREGLPVFTGMIMQARNAENRRLMLDRYGVERFVQETRPVVVNFSGQDQLLRFGEGKDAMLMLYLKDTSTPRRYLLRVPPNTRSVQDGVAWTFGMDPSQYAPVKES